MDRINRLYGIWFLLALFALTACSEESLEGGSGSEFMPLTIDALVPTTRTTLGEDGTTVQWQADDQIAVYDYQATKHAFSAQIGTDGHTKFTGQVTAKSQYFAAIYPYALAGDNASANSALTATLPATQYAVAGDFPQGTVNETTAVCNISVAKGERNLDGSPAVVTFHNVCQMLRFTVPAYADGQISSIQFTAPSAVVGKLTINYSGNEPTVSIASTESKVINVLPPRRTSTFAAGTYYIVTAPVRLSGFTMTSASSGKNYSLSSTSTFGGNAGRIYNLGSIDLVNTPTVSASHIYTDNVLQGTRVTLTGAPIEGKNWTATIKNSAGTTVRTLSGTGNLTSAETDASWPYLPKGNYTVTYNYTTSNGKAMTGSLILTVPQMTRNFTPSLSAYTSYSYYVGDGVTQSISNANTCANNIIYAPTVRISGIANAILNNSHYTFTVTPSGFTNSLKSKADGVYTYNNTTADTWQAYTLSASVSFDGVTANTGNKTVYITGLPYSVAPPTNSGSHAWSEVQGGGKIKWNSGNVALGDGGTATADPMVKSPSFYLPNAINVTLSAAGTLHTRQVAVYYRATLTMYVGDSSVWEQTSPQKSTTAANFNPVINTSLSGSSNYVKFSTDTRTALSGYAYITSVSLQYR